MNDKNCCQQNELKLNDQESNPKKLSNILPKLSKKSSKIQKQSKFRLKKTKNRFSYKNKQFTERSSRLRISFEDSEEFESSQQFQQTSNKQGKISQEVDFGENQNSFQLLQESNFTRMNSHNIFTYETNLSRCPLNFSREASFDLNNFPLMLEKHGSINQQFNLAQGLLTRTNSEIMREENNIFLSGKFELDMRLNDIIPLQKSYQY